MKQEKFILKNCMFTAGQYWSTEKVMKSIRKCYIFIFKFDWIKKKNFFIHFRSFPSDNFFNVFLNNYKV